MKVMLSRLFALLIALLCGFRPAANAQTPALAAGLEFFLTDESLWSLPAAEMPERLAPAGYTVNASTSVITLGEPREMLKRKAFIFTDDLAVWKATLTQGAALRTVILDLLPPATLARTPDKAGFRTLTKRLEERLTATLKSAPAVHPYHGDSLPDRHQVTCQRWVGKSVQAVLVTSTAETRGVFTPQRIELKIMAAAVPGKSTVMKPRGA